MQTLYRIIYHKNINFILRNLNKLLSPFLHNKIRIPPSGVININISKENVLKIKTNQTNYITKLIFWNGYKNFEYTKIFIPLAKKVKTFYDIGANIGYYSLLAAMVNNTAKIVGFEPASGPLHYFRENVRINRFSNIYIEPIALSDKEGEIKFHEVFSPKYKYLEHNLAGEGNTGSKQTAGKYVIKTVNATTLDSYVTRQNEESIDLIKIDTEGTENLILEKSSFVLRNMKPVIICETLFQTIEPELERIMRSHGYELYAHYECGLVKVDTILRDKDNGVRNCFFVHPEKKSLIEEFICS